MNSDKILNYPEPSAELLPKILRRIELEQKLRAMRRRFIIAAISLFGAGASLVPTWQSFKFNSYQTGFGQFLNLALYDFKTVAANWQDYALTLLESLPVISAVLMLSAFLGFLLAVKYTLKNGKAIFRPSIFANLK